MNTTHESSSFRKRIFDRHASDVLEVVFVGDFNLGFYRGHASKVNRLRSNIPFTF